jgi:hypothetical protein
MILYYLIRPYPQVTRHGYGYRYTTGSEYRGYGYTRGFHAGFFTGTGTGTASETRTRQLDPCLSNNRIQITLFRFLFFFGKKTYF